MAENKIKNTGFQGFTPCGLKLEPTRKVGELNGFSVSKYSNIGGNVQYVRRLDKLEEHNDPMPKVSNHHDVHPYVTRLNCLPDERGSLGNHCRSPGFECDSKFKSKDSIAFSTGKPGDFDGKKLRDHATTKSHRSIYNFQKPCNSLRHGTELKSCYQHDIEGRLCNNRYINDLVYGTTKTTCNIPGYSGFIPASRRNVELYQQQNMTINRAAPHDLKMNFQYNIPGYSGYQPHSVENKISEVLCGTMTQTSAGAGAAGLLL